MKILTDTFLRMMDRRHIEDTFVDGLEIVDRGEGDDFDGEGYFQCDSVVFKCSKCKGKMKRIFAFFEFSG